MSIIVSTSCTAHFFLTTDPLIGFNASNTQGTDSFNIPILTTRTSSIKNAIVYHLRLLRTTLLKLSYREVIVSADIGNDTLLRYWFHTTVRNTFNSPNLRAPSKVITVSFIGFDDVTPGINICNKYKVPQTPFTLDCTRNGPLGNPFRMKSKDDRDNVCDLFESDFQRRLKEGDKRLKLALSGALKFYLNYGRIDLTCCCAPCRCHTESYKRWLEGKIEEGLDTIIAGGRDFTKTTVLTTATDTLGWKIKCVIDGGARGADKEGREYSLSALQKPSIVFKADWDKHGKRAGMLRNTEMGEAADALLLFWDGASSGSKSMLSIAGTLKLPTEVVLYRNS